jgi:hypothetical protein
MIFRKLREFITTLLFMNQRSILYVNTMMILLRQFMIPAMVPLVIYSILKM